MNDLRKIAGKIRNSTKEKIAQNSEFDIGNYGKIKIHLGTHNKYEYNINLYGNFHSFLPSQEIISVLKKTFVQINEK